MSSTTCISSSFSPFVISKSLSPLRWHLLAMERQWIDQVGIMETNTLGAGRTMHAISSYWKHQVVAIKIPRCVHQDPFETAEYNRFMYDIFFEMQVMTHKSLSSHPNIVKLLGVSFVTTVKEKDVQIF